MCDTPRYTLSSSQVDRDTLPTRLIRSLLCMHPNDREGEALRRACRKNASATSVSIENDGTLGGASTISEALTLFDNLEELEVKGGSLKSSPRVKKLSLIDVDIHSCELVEGLSDLCLKGIITTTPRLAAFILTPLNKNTLTVLNLTDVIHVTDYSLLDIVNGLSGLRKIELVNLQRLTAVGLRKAFELSLLESVTLKDLQIDILDDSTFPLCLSYLQLKNIHTSDYIGKLLTDPLSLKVLVLDGSQVSTCQIEWDILVLENLQKLKIKNNHALSAYGFDKRRSVI